MSPYGVFNEGGGGGGGASPYHTTPDVWSSGASPFQGGGGSSGMGGSIYGGGGGFSGGSYGGFGGDSFGSFGGGRQDPYPNMSMPGGLGMPASSPSGAQPLDWGPVRRRRHRQSGRTRYHRRRWLEWPTVDPSPGMAMPGGLGSPMTDAAAQSSGIQWACRRCGWRQQRLIRPASHPTCPAARRLQAALAGSRPPTSATNRRQTGGQTLARGAAASEPGAAAGTRTYDFKPMFEGGGGGGFGSGGTDSQTFGSPGRRIDSAGNLQYIQSGEAPVQAQGTLQRRQIRRALSQRKPGLGSRASSAVQRPRKR